MFGYGWCSDMGALGWLLMFGFWAGFVALVVWAVARLFPSGSPNRPSDLQRLDRRFASGEIDEEEYRRARDEVATRAAWR